ncbi:Phosphate regulon sensor protein PhoR (SphS) [hydrothermal vent metagenome]|uniref:Phosphate regulon sensor protein PhoR n=1 Tax=hydrothermal vent metagenome TaxID=652676 RepID=A0A3B1ABP9_9ZZZZ
MNKSWNAELWRLAALLVATTVLGLIFDYVFLFLTIALSGYLAWTFINLRNMYRWLAVGKKFSPPNSAGVWGELFTEIYKLQKRNKKRQKRLVNLLARFRETTEAMPDGVVVMQANGTIEWWNDVGSKLLRLNYPQDVGQRITNLVRNPEFHNFYQRAEQDEIFHMSAPGDGNKTIAIQITPYGQHQSLLTARDVTLLERVEQIRRDFVANISHELRTPLTVMTGFLETMASEPHEQDAETQRSIELMQQQSKRMQRLVEDLMLLSKLENEHKPIKHDVVAVPKMLLTLKDEAEVVSGERKHKIVIEQDEDLYLYGDAKELDSVFSNLVINAINYSPDEGQITIRWFENDSVAVFEVSDNGIGIPSHHLSRLTERFYRVDVARSRETGGSGLGLAIVKHALNRHLATLKIKSNVGKGTTVTCTFSSDATVRKDKIRQVV